MGMWGARRRERREEGGPCCSPIPIESLFSGPVGVCDAPRAGERSQPNKQRGASSPSWRECLGWEFIQTQEEGGASWRGAGGGGGKWGRAPDWEGELFTTSYLLLRF